MVLLDNVSVFRVTFPSLGCLWLLLWILHTQRLACVVCHRNVPVERACVVWHILVLQQKMWPDIRFRVRADYRWYDKTPEVGWCGVNEGSCTSTGPREVTRSFPCRQIVRLKLMLACWYALSFCLVSTWNACLVVLPYPVWLHAHMWVTRHRIQRKSSLKSIFFMLVLNLSPAVINLNANIWLLWSNGRLMKYFWYSADLWWWWTEIFFFFSWRRETWHFYLADIMRPALECGWTVAHKLHP